MGTFRLPSKLKDPSVPNRGFVIHVDDVSTWVDFMAFIKEQQRRNFSDGLCLPTWVFRGQGSCKWGLTSSFERQYRYLGDEAQMHEIERRSIALFQQLSQHFLPEVVRQGSCRAEILACMQHYGVPTRLLDFTYAPLIALYFAVVQDPEMGDVDFAVWATHLNAVNSLYARELRSRTLQKIPKGHVGTIHAAQTDSTRSNNQERMKWDREYLEKILKDSSEALRSPMLAYDSIFPNPRMRVQRGLFLTSTLLSVPFEKAFYDWHYFDKPEFAEEQEPLSKLFDGHRVNPDYMANAVAFKFVFSSKLRIRARSYLDIANVRPSVLMPDLGGVAKEVVDELRRVGSMK